MQMLTLQDKKHQVDAVRKTSKKQKECEYCGRRHENIEETRGKQ